MAKATREAYGEMIARLVQENPKVVVLDADLAGSTYSVKAKEVCPERLVYLQVLRQADIFRLHQVLQCSAQAVYGNRSVTALPIRI